MLDRYDQLINAILLIDIIIMYSSCRRQENGCVNGERWVLQSPRELASVWRPAQQHQQSCMMMETRTPTSAHHHHHHPWNGCEWQQQMAMNGGFQSLYHHHRHHYQHQQLSHQFNQAVVDQSSVDTVESIACRYHVDDSSHFQHGRHAAQV